MPVPRPRPFGRSATFCNATRRIAFCLVALGSDIGCSSSVPSAPALDFTVSGYVYGQHNGENGEPLIVDAVITARDADGHDISAVTDSKGFYTVRVRSGAVSIGATKAGYDASLSQEFTLSGNTVLNFRLLAKSPESVRSGSKRGLVHAARRDASLERGPLYVLPSSLLRSRAGRRVTASDWVGSCQPRPH